MHGHLIGPFRIQEIMRISGHGVSYRAADPLGDPVLLRVFPPLGAEGTRWLERLRELMSRLRPLGDVPLVNFSDTGVVDRLTYVSRPFVEGATLADVSPGTLSVVELVDIGRRLGDILTRMHAEGVVHGRLRASNVILHGPHLRVVDFGLAFPETEWTAPQDDVQAVGRILRGLLMRTSRGVPPATGRVLENLVAGEVTDAAEIAPRLTASFVGAPRRFRGLLGRSLAAPSAKAGAPPGARVVNTWFNGDPPFPPLRAGQRVFFNFNIGRPRHEALGATTEFSEPDFGRRDHLMLLVSLFSEDFAIEQRQQMLVLPKRGDTNTLFSVVTPRHAGPCRLEMVISLAKELDVLQQLHVDVDVAPSGPTAGVTAGAGAPSA